MSVTVIEKAISKVSGHDKSHLMLFDLEVYGHHANYIRLIIEYWIKYYKQGYLSIVVTPDFIDHHQSLVKFVRQNPGKNIKFQPITRNEHQQLYDTSRRFSRFFRRFQEWALLCKYALALKASHCLIMHVDKLQLPFILRKRLPCAASAISFQLSFHYPSLSQSSKMPVSYYKSLRDKIFLNQIFNNPQVRNIFCLDPYAVKAINSEFLTATNVIHLPDPVDLPTNLNSAEISKFRSNLEMDSDRQLFLVFGHLNWRKGIFQILDSISYLSKESCQKLCLAFVGKPDAQTKLTIESQIKNITSAKPIQILTDFKFVSEQTINSYFQACEVVLAPYQRHLGMSGILLLAAAHNKPVISQEYGLMGELVRHHELGITVDSLDPVSIAKDLTSFIQNDKKTFYSQAKASNFATLHSSENFAKTIFENLEVNGVTVDF